MLNNSVLDPDRLFQWLLYHHCFEGIGILWETASALDTRLEGKELSYFPATLLSTTDFTTVSPLVEFMTIISPLHSSE